MMVFFLFCNVSIRLVIKKLIETYFLFLLCKCRLIGLGVQNCGDNFIRSRFYSYYLANYSCDYNQTINFFFLKIVLLSKINTLNDFNFFNLLVQFSYGKTVILEFDCLILISTILTIRKIYKSSWSKWEQIQVESRLLLFIEQILQNPNLLPDKFSQFQISSLVYFYQFILVTQNCLLVCYDS